MHSDNWANKAKQMGYRSRAVFKLEENLNKIKFKKNFNNVLDIGSAQGWSQYIIKNFPKSKVYTLKDILDMEPIEEFFFLKKVMKLIL